MNKLVLLSVSMRNFMSYGNNVSTLRLDSPGTSFICGQDLDSTTNGTGSNGVGKTSVLNAVVFALYNRALAEDIAVDGLINNINKKNMEVTLDFTCGGEYYRIVRARKMKSGPSGNYVKFYRRSTDCNFTEDDDTSKGNSVYDTDADILKVIGVKFDIFTRIVIFSAMKESFFSLPLRSHGTSKRANQTDFIEELFGITEVSRKAETLKQQIKDISRRQQLVQSEIEHLEREHDRYREQLASAKARVSNWEISREEDITSINETMNEYADYDFQDAYSRLDTIDQLNQSISEKNALGVKIDAMIKAQMKSKATNEKELSILNDHNCPYCNQEFADNQHKQSECTANIEKCDEQLATLTEAREQINEEVKTLQDQLAAIPVPKLSKPKLISIENMITKGREDIARLQAATNPYIEPLEELERMKVQAVDYTEINSLKKQVEHGEFLHKLLTKKDSFVRRNLLNKNLPYLNQQLALYLNSLGLPHKVEFTHELTAKISQFGRELAFGNLSAGQKARVNIALSFAFRDVLQSMHVPVNICMLDEILDVGLNSSGIQSAVKMLKAKARDEKLSMFIISHREEVDSSFDRIIMIQRSKEFSYIFVDDEAPPLTSS